MGGGGLPRLGMDNINMSDRFQGVSAGCEPVVLDRVAKQYIMQPRVYYYTRQLCRRVGRCQAFVHGS